MRGFEHVGHVAPDCFLEIERELPPDGLLFYAASHDAKKRNGHDRVRDVIYWDATPRRSCHVFYLPSHSKCRTVAAGDYVYLATAIGEHAFDPAPPVTAQ